MGKYDKHSTGKIIAFIGGLSGLIIVLLGLFEKSMGWWQIVYDGPGSFLDGISYISAFGSSSSTYNDDIEFLAGSFALGGILFLIGSAAMVVAAAKETKIGAIICGFLMIGGLIAFCYALNTYEDLQDIISGLSFLFGDEFNPFFGTAEIGLLGELNWRLGNGFFAAIVATLIAFFGAIKID